jgi:hypothetical protein
MSNAMPAGYSGTPLVKKLGYQPGFRVYLDNAPEDYADLVPPLPEAVQILDKLAYLAQLAQKTNYFRPDFLQISRVFGSGNAFLAL